MSAAAEALGPVRPTVLVWLDEWVGRQVARGRWSDGTVRRHRSNVVQHLARTVGPRPLAELTVEDVEALDALLAAEGLSAKSRASVHGTLRQALGAAVKAELVTRNVASVAGGPTVRRPEIIVPADGGVHALLHLAALVHEDGTGPAWVHPFLRLAAYTGARPGELAALRWADVDLTRREVHVHAHARPGPDGKLVVVEGTKAGPGRRIAIDATTAAVLDRWRVACNSPHPTDWLVFPRLGEPLPAHLPRRWFRRLADRAGVDKRCTLYSLRHWHASHLLRNGGSVTQVAERMGHSNPTLTLNVYGRHVPAADRALADLLEKSDE